MDIVVLVDIVTTVITLIALWILMVRLFFTEAGLYPLLGCMPPLVIVFVVMVVLRPVRYSLAGVIVLGVFLIHLLAFARRIPHKQRLKRGYQYVGRALFKHLYQYPIVPIIAYGYQTPESEHYGTGYVHLMVSPTMFDTYFVAGQQVSGSWKTVEIPAMDHQSDTKPYVFLALVVEITDEQSLYMPLYVGRPPFVRVEGNTTYTDHTYNYVWQRTLSHINHDDALIRIYPMEANQLKAFQSVSDKYEHFMSHHYHDPHITVKPVPIDDEPFKHPTDKPAKHRTFKRRLSIFQTGEDGMLKSIEITRKLQK